MSWTPGYQIPTPNSSDSDSQYGFVGSVAVIDVVGTSDTISAAECGQIRRYTDNALVTVTLPDNVPIGETVNLLFWGTAGGAVQDNGVSVVQIEGTVAQFGEVSCTVVDTDTWSVVGAIV